MVQFVLRSAEGTCCDCGCCCFAFCSTRIFSCISALNFAARVFGHNAGLRRASNRLVKASIFSCWAARLKVAAWAFVSKRRKEDEKRTYGLSLTFCPGLVSHPVQFPHPIFLLFKPRFRRCVPRLRRRKRQPRVQNAIAQKPTEKSCLYTSAFDKSRSAFPAVAAGFRGKLEGGGGSPALSGVNFGFSDFA